MNCIREGADAFCSHPLAAMAPQDTSVELRPNVAKEIRDRLVGKIFQVKLKIDSHQDDGRSPRGLFKRFASKIGSSRPARGQSAKEHKQDAAVLLTVESVEVYSSSNEGNVRDHVEAPQDSDSSAPPLHSPPSSLEGHVYSYSISMSQVSDDPPYMSRGSSYLLQLQEGIMAEG